MRIESHFDMAMAILVTLEKELPDAQAAYQKADSGKALFREADELDFAARCKGVTQPSALLSESTSKLAEQMRADGFDPAKMRLPPEQWYSATDGLKVVRALMEYVSANLNSFKQPNPILKSLRAAEALLSPAEAAGIRFHFTKAEI
jgi:hypothetical protein